MVFRFPCSFFSCVVNSFLSLIISFLFRSEALSIFIRLVFSFFLLISPETCSVLLSRSMAFAVGMVSSVNGSGFRLFFQWRRYQRLSLSNCSRFSFWICLLMESTWFSATAV